MDIDKSQYHPLTEADYAEALASMNTWVDEFFAFQALVCTTQPDCECGREHSEPTP